MILVLQIIIQPARHLVVVFIMIKVNEYICRQTLSFALGLEVYCQKCSQGTWERILNFPLCFTWGICLYHISGLCCLLLECYFWIYPSPDQLLLSELLVWSTGNASYCSCCGWLNWSPNQDIFTFVASLMHCCLMRVVLNCKHVKCVKNVRARLSSAPCITRHMENVTIIVFTWRKMYANKEILKCIRKSFQKMTVTQSLCADLVVIIHWFYMLCVGLY